MDDVLLIRPGLIIPRNEVWFEFSHASGPGGQNVNKVATAVSLCFHPASSAVLTQLQKDLIHARLARRINADGVLRVTAEDGRTQAGNRRLVAGRFCALLAEVLRPVKRRTATRPTRSSVERRLVDKRFRAARKSGRKRELGDYEE